MFKTAQRASAPVSATRPRVAATVLETSANWLAMDEDVMLGCECAQPALQIDRWGQEMHSFPLTPLASN